MKTIHLILPVCLAATLGVRAAEQNALKTDREKISYALGMNIGSAWKLEDIAVDNDLVLRGIKDAMSGGPTLLTEQESTQVWNKYQQALPERNQKRADEFLAKNKTAPGVVTTESGLQYKILTEGTGPTPGSNDFVTVNYRGKLLNGVEFDSSYKRNQPSTIPVNRGPKGWTEGLHRMKVGSKWQLFVPPNLAYGERGVPGIPPNSLVVFEIELLTNAPPPAPAPTPAPNTPLTSDIIKVPSLEDMKKGAQPETIKAEDVEKLLKQMATNQPSAQEKK